MKEHSTQVVRTADVISKTVIDNNNEKLGKVEELVLDKCSGEVRYAVLSFGGFMGMGSDFYALPWQELDYCPEEDAFKVSVPKDILKTAPGFDKDNWPDFANVGWSKPVDEFYHSPQQYGSRTQFDQNNRI
ncbi:MAG: PRC-barrel domain protein [Burkholderiales bacterium]|jgi:sporulation protein YlmC with PRC-barrel domain|nr:PRC-barrel domain protein [Burkholderiales bacterium]